MLNIHTSNSVGQTIPIGYIKLFRKDALTMDLNLRKAIISNISSNDPSQLEATIVDAIQQGEEKMLPGLGVLFELIWKQSDEQDKQEMVNALEQGVKEASSSM